MFPKSIAGIPSQSGWYSKSLLDFWRRHAKLRQSCRTPPRANPCQEKLRQRGKATREEMSWKEFERDSRLRKKRSPQKRTGGPRSSALRFAEFQSGISRRREWTSYSARG